MSIYIKGMKMPTNCEDCPMCHSNAEYDYAYCCVSSAETSGNKIPSNCPLISIPAHGRLIDADALLMRINYEVMEAYMDGVCYGVHPSQEYLDLLGEIIDDTPTIIPEEEEEEI